MYETNSSNRDAGPHPDCFKLRKLRVNLGKAYVRLPAANRRNVMRAFEEFTFGKNRTTSYWERWSNDDMKCCYLQLKPISPKLANDFRTWATALLGTGHNDKLTLKCLMDELEVRTWIEEP